jgi:transposase
MRARCDPARAAVPVARTHRTANRQRRITAPDHATGAIVWCLPGRNSGASQAFFEELGDRRSTIRASSIDLSGEYHRAIRAAVPAATGAEHSPATQTRKSSLAAVRARHARLR